MCYCTPSSRTTMCGSYTCRKQFAESGDTLNVTDTNKLKYPKMPRVKPPKEETTLERELKHFINLEPDICEGGLDYNIETDKFKLEIKYTVK